MPRRARRIERRIRNALGELASRFELIGDVRGRGVLLGIELVEDRRTRRPANDAVRRIAAECEANGLIFQTRGVRDLHNVIRLVPPMTTTDAEVDRAMAILGDAVARAAKAGRRRK